MGEVRKVSFSRLSQFQLCPRQYWFRQLRLPEVPAKPLVLGNIVHQLAELILTDPTAPTSTVEQRAQELVASSPLLTEEDLQTVLNMLEAIRRYELLPQAERQVERWLELPITDGILLQGKADLIEITPEQVRITDWKTGWIEYGPDATQQLDLYAAVLVRERPGVPIYVQLRFLRYGEKRGLVGRESTPEHQERALQWARRVADAIAAAHQMPWRVGFPARPGRACKTCSYAPQCLLLRAQELGVDDAGGLDLLRAVLEAVFAEPQDEEAAADAASWLLVLERAVEILRQWLRAYVERAGPVETGGLRLGLRFATGWEVHDWEVFLRGLKELDLNPRDYLRVNDNVKELAATAQGQELLRRCAEQVVRRPTWPGGMGMESDRPDMRYVVIDVETTGLDPERHRIIELAVVTVNGDTDASTEWSSLVRPLDGELDPQALAVNGITLEQLAEAPPEAEVVRRLAAMLYQQEGQTVLVAHHLPFDLGFVNAAFRRHGVPEWSGPFICTRSLAALVLPDLPSRRLADVAAALEVPMGTAHRALEDARVTARVLVLLLEQARRMGIDPVNVLVQRPDRPLQWVPPGARVVTI